MDLDSRRRASQLIAGLVLTHAAVSQAERRFVDRLFDAFELPADDRVSAAVYCADEAARELSRLAPEARASALERLYRAATPGGQLVSEAHANIVIAARALGGSYLSPS